MILKAPQPTLRRPIQPSEVDLCKRIIGRALLTPDQPLAPVNTTLPMHMWLIDHGMAPGLVMQEDGPDLPGWTVIDIDHARAAVGASAWHARAWQPRTWP